MYIQFDDGELLELLGSVDNFNNEELHIRIRMRSDLSTDYYRNLAVNSTKIKIYNDMTSAPITTYEYFNKVLSTNRVEKTDMTEEHVYIIVRRPPVDYDYFQAAKIIMGEA